MIWFSKVLTFMFIFVTVYQFFKIWQSLFKEWFDKK